MEKKRIRENCGGIMVAALKDVVKLPLGAQLILLFLNSMFTSNKSFKAHPRRLSSFSWSFHVSPTGKLIKNFLINLNMKLN